MSKPTCSDPEGCDRPAVARGLCGKHHQKARRAGMSRQPPRERPKCSVEGCGKPHEARGWCEKHYDRWKRTGDPLSAKIFFGSTEDRFWHYVDKHGPDECWPWTGTITRNGYGQIWDESVAIAAHVIAYRIAGKVVPDGLQLDHTCHDPAACTPGKTCLHRRCCNPAHLEAVAGIVNNSRSGSPSAANARKEACSRAGHPYDEANTVWRLRTRANGTTCLARYCRACANEDARKRRQKNRPAA